MSKTSGLAQPQSVTREELFRLAHVDVIGILQNRLERSIAAKAANPLDVVGEVHRCAAGVSVHKLGSLLSFRICKTKPSRRTEFTHPQASRSLRWRRVRRRGA